MIHPKLVPSLLLVGALAFGVATTPAKAQVNLGSGIVINDIDLTGVAIDPVTGILSATGGTVTGTIAGLPFTTAITDFAIDLLPDNPATPAEECSVLHLALAPIDLDLLGLSVDTSAICLNITAIEGGGLLGNLLCSLAGGDGLLGNLTDLQRLALLDAILDGLGDLTGTLTRALNQGLAQQGTQATQDICDGECEVLDLAVGPVDLTLLGLHVVLDNCDDGPVQVCVSATAGAGLLGDLLCGLTDGGLLGNINLGAIEDLLDSILGALGNATPNATNQQVNQLVKQVGKALGDGNLSDKESQQISKSVQKIVRKG
jgi:hypothetical protein